LSITFENIIKKEVFEEDEVVDIWISNLCFQINEDGVKKDFRVCDLIDFSNEPRGEINLYFISEIFVKFDFSLEIKKNLK
jgi:hypothetical protein